jgi:membrane associated rhomboid family serine protease
MFPYRDDNPRVSTPVVTIGLIAANIFVWVAFQGMGTQSSLIRSMCTLGLIPAAVVHHLPQGSVVQLGEGITCSLGVLPTWLTPLTSMFAHGGWVHLIGNMWFLWLFGDNVEDIMGPGRYLLFYLLSGLAAAAAQVLGNPASPLPMVGASGAISGVMGAYVILFPTVRVHLWVFLGIFMTRTAVPAYVMLGYWFLLQLLGGMAGATEGGGVAFAAHVGGFVAGALLVGVFKSRTLMARRQERLSGF